MLPEFELPIKQINLGDFSEKKSTSKRNPEVVKLQQALNLKGANLKVDGIRGAKTAAAENRFDGTTRMQPVTQLAPNLNKPADNTRVSKPNDFGKPLDSKSLPKSNLSPELQKYITQRPRTEVKPAFEGEKTSVLPNLGSFGNSSLASKQALGDIINSRTKGLTGEKELVNLEINNKNVSSEHKKALYKIIENKVQKTGKLQGGITYEEYEAVLGKEGVKTLLAHTKGKKGEMAQVRDSFIEPAIDLGLSLGEFSYVKDPKTGKIKVSDAYDFLNKSNVDKDGKFVKNWADKAAKESKNTTAYFSLHDKLAHYEAEATRLGTKNMKNRVVDVDLMPSDTANVKPSFFIKNARKLAGKLLK